MIPLEACTVPVDFNEDTIQPMPFHGCLCRRLNLIICIFQLNLYGSNDGLRQYLRKTYGRLISVFAGRLKMYSTFVVGESIDVCFIYVDIQIQGSKL